MKKNKKEKTKTSIINEYNYGYIFLQFALTVVVLVFFILFLVLDKYIKVLTFFLGILLLVMGYNNTMVYHRKNYTKIYYISGIITLIVFILMIIGVI